MDETEEVTQTARAIAQHAALPPGTAFDGATRNEETGTIMVIFGGKGWCLMGGAAITWEPHAQGVRVMAYRDGEPLGARLIKPDDFAH